MSMISCSYGSTFLSIEEQENGRYSYRYNVLTENIKKQFECSENFANEAYRLVRETILKIEALPLGPYCKNCGTAGLPSIALFAMTDDSKLMFLEEDYPQLRAMVNRDVLESLFLELCRQIDAMAEHDWERIQKSYPYKKSFCKAPKGLLERYFK